MTVTISSVQFSSKDNNKKKENKEGWGFHVEKYGFCSSASGKKYLLQTNKHGWRLSRVCLFCQRHHAHARAHSPMCNWEEERKKGVEKKRWNCFNPTPFGVFIALRRVAGLVGRWTHRRGLRGFCSATFVSVKSAQSAFVKMELPVRVLMCTVKDGTWWVWVCQCVRGRTQRRESPILTFGVCWGSCGVVEDRDQPNPCRVFFFDREYSKHQRNIDTTFYTSYLICLDLPLSIPFIKFNLFI